MTHGETPASVTTSSVAKWRTPQVREEMARRYVQEGQSLRQIATALGCGYGTVHLVLTEAQVPLRPKGGSRHRTRRAP